jgi:hypothetical protein
MDIYDNPYEQSKEVTAGGGSVFITPAVTPTETKTIAVTPVQCQAQRHTALLNS